MDTISHIIIAEDDEDDILLMQEAFENKCPHAAITSVIDGQELLSILGKAPHPDLIVMDLYLPKKNARECLREIGNNKKFKDIPVAVFCTTPQETDIEYCLSHGAKFFFAKPYNYLDLENIIELLCKPR